MKPNLIVIGLSGRKRSGKDVTADSILKQLRYMDGIKLPFASFLKDEVCRAMNIKPEYLEEHKENFRLILQGWGTDYRRMLCGNDYWIKKWLKAVRDTRSNLIVVPDVRFENEAACIKEIGGEMWRVENKRIESGIHEHKSETEMDFYPYFTRYIRNDGTLANLDVEVSTSLEMSKLT